MLGTPRYRKHGRALVLSLTLAMIVAPGAGATPIRPDIKKLLEQPADASTNFAPARAGWHGPESAKSEAATNPVLEKFSPAGTARAIRESLIAVAIPDWRVIATILAVIFILRKVRKSEPRETQPATEAEQLRPAA